MLSKEEIEIDDSVFNEQIKKHNINKIKNDKVY